MYKLAVRGNAEASRYSKEDVAALEASVDDAEMRATKVYSRELIWQPQGGQVRRLLGWPMEGSSVCASHAKKLQPAWPARAPAPHAG